METWHGQKVGTEVLRHCGPAAADLIYDFYASDEQLKWPALVSIARLGVPAYQVFDRFRSYDKFHIFLRRASTELMNPHENPPAIVHAIDAIAKSGQQQVDIYAQVPNLKGQVLADSRGPSPSESYLEWIPGYIAYRTAMNYANGRHVTGGEIFWSMVDAVSVATLVYGPVSSGLKSLGSKLGQRGVEGALRQAEQKLAEIGERIALQALRDEGAALTQRFGEKSGMIAQRRLLSRIEGLTLDLTDRRAQYLELAKAGDISGKARLVEEIGIEGAQKYIAEVRYEPLYQGLSRRGMGFDLPPCRDGNRLVVIEAKGGSSPLKTYHGHEQGTIEYTQAVAEWTLRSASTTVEEKKAAQEVLKAAREGRLYIEVVRTEHVQGRPGKTYVEKIIGPRGPITFSLQEARGALALTPGMVTAWVREASGVALARQDLSAWLGQGQVLGRRLGIALWTQGNAGPLAGRYVIRKGEKKFVPVLNLHPASGVGVSDFTMAIMERGI
jgi:hypothetical protein